MENDKTSLNEADYAFVLKLLADANIHGIVSIEYRGLIVRLAPIKERSPQSSQQAYTAQFRNVVPRG